MPFQPGHPPYRRRSNLAVSEPETVETTAEIRRWTLDDFDEWLGVRLRHRWGGVDLVWRNKLLGFTLGNDYLFITNGEAVLLAMQQRHLMIGKPVVQEVFAWARAVPVRDGVYGATQGTDEGAALKPLYRRLREWGKAMDATRLYVGVCSDILPSDLKEMLGKGAYYIVGAPC